MANFVYNEVLCSKGFLDTFLLDNYPIEPGKKVGEPYITFNKLFGIQTLGEYSEKIGVHIYYGFGFSWQKQPDGRYEVKFCTRWEYPIQAILKSLELSHDIEWFAVEKNCVYASKFYWNNGAREDIMPLGDSYYEWNNAHEILEESLEYWDNDVWYYMQAIQPIWKTWGSQDNFERYKNKSAYEIEPPL